MIQQPKQQLNNNITNKLLNSKDKVLLDLLFYDLVFKYANQETLKSINYSNINSYFNVDIDHHDVELSINGSCIKVDIKDSFIKWLLVGIKIGKLLRLYKLLSFENKTLKDYYLKNKLKSL